jgi:hypothetical protein
MTGIFGSVYISATHKDLGIMCQILLKAVSVRLLSNGVKERDTWPPIFPAGENGSRSKWFVLNNPFVSSSVLYCEAKEM